MAPLSSGNRVSTAASAANSTLGLGQVVAIPVAIILAILIGLLVYIILKKKHDSDVEVDEYEQKMDGTNRDSDFSYASDQYRGENHGDEERPETPRPSQQAQVLYGPTHDEQGRVIPPWQRLLPPPSPLPSPVPPAAMRS